MPGAPTGQPPMAAHGGYIGAPQQYTQHPAQQPHQHLHGQSPVMGGGHAVPMHDGATDPNAPMYAHGHPHQAHGHAMHQPQLQPHQHAPQPQHYPGDPYGAPQAWAYPTSNGMQYVASGGAAPTPVPALQMLPGGGQHEAAASTRRRVRWETIVPAMAVLFLLVAVGLFVARFDRITGRDGGSDKAASKHVADTGTGTATPTSDATGGDDVQSVLAQARDLQAKGDYTGAADLLHPILEGPNANKDAIALHEQIDADGARLDALMQALPAQRSAKNWKAIAATISQIEMLRPLTPSLVKLRTAARKASKAAAAGPSVQSTIDRARALDRQGKTAQALALVERAMGKRANARLSRLREELAAKVAGPSTAPTSGISGGGNSGSAGRPVAPPSSAGGARPSAPAAMPPANIPSGTVPTPPNVANINTTGATGGGGSTGTMANMPGMEHACATRHGAEEHAGAC